jgi:hypothetical protein
LRRKDQYRVASFGSFCGHRVSPIIRTSAIARSWDLAVLLKE